MKKVLFIDRDGTIIEEPEDEQVDSFEKFMFLPGAITALSAIASELDYELVMVTNQDGLGSPSFPENTFWPVHDKMIKILEGEGIRFSQVFIDRTKPEDKAPTRKPGTAMLTRYLATGIDMESSYVIGDRKTDIELAGNLGCKAILIGEKPDKRAVLTTMDWNAIYRFLKKIPRRAVIERKTSETAISAEINLDGNGKSSIKTGIGFFDHMLAQIPNHGKIDLFVTAKGDLEVDVHHTIEDTGLAIGSAFYEALGKKKGINRYGFVLPMDDALAQVAIDFGGRPMLVWNVKLNNDSTGGIPSDLFSHFFRSFCDNARCNLNIEASGVNDHHIIEAVFKAFARSAAQAVALTGSNSIPSSKGIL